MRRHVSQKPVLEKISLYKKEFPVSLRWVREDVRNPYRFFLAWHPEIEFHIVTKGGGKYLINGKFYAVGPNSLIIIQPREIHKFKPDSKGCERISLLFQPSWLGKDYRLGGDFPRHLLLSDREMILLNDILRLVSEDVDHQLPLWKELVKERLREFILLVKRAAMRPLPTVSVNPLMNQLLKYLDQNFVHPDSLAQLSKHFGLSASYLSRSFSNYAGIGVKEYVLQRRIMEARKIMESNPCLKLSAIAEQVGFGSYALFNRVFVRLVRMPPSRYIKK